MRCLSLICLLLMPLIVTGLASPCQAQFAAPPTELRPNVRQSDPYIVQLPARAYAYHRASRVLLFVSIGWHVLGLALFLRTGLSAAARDLVEQRFHGSKRGSAENHDTFARDIRAPSFTKVALYYIIYTSALLFWTLPVGLCALTIERKFGFSHETIGLFLRDRVVNLCLGWAFIPVVWLGYRLYARRPRHWWLYVWSGLVPLTFFVMVLYPVVVSPLFNHYTRLTAGPLRTKILALAAKAGVHNGQVFVEDTSVRTAHVNAYVIGIGPSTRIVLNDTALRELPENQILAMVGHEMGHYVEHHVLIGFATGAVGSGLLLGSLAALVPGLIKRFNSSCRFRSPQDLAALPLVMLVVYVLTLLGQPFENAISRRLEHRADAYGLRLTGLQDATARLMVGFAERDLSDPNPPILLHLWFGTHPMLSERIAFARHYPNRGSAAAAK